MPNKKTKQDALPSTITLKPDVKKYLMMLKDKRQMTQRENDVVAGIAFALGIDNKRYAYNDDKICFVLKK